MPHIYKPEEQWSTEIGFPSALAIGDSWFWYVNNNMLGTLVKHPALNNDYRNLQLVGYNGARLKDYVGAGKYAETVNYFLRPDFARSFAAFYISGAGNDAVDYGLALRDDCRGVDKAADCIDDDHMDTMLSALRQSLGQLLVGILTATAGRSVPPPIFLHGYDYPIPDNRGFDLGLIHSGPWLAPAMDRHKVEPNMALRSDIAKILIDRLNEDVLAPLAAATEGAVHIDSRGILPRDSYRDYWANELHPTNHGFERIFDQAWLPTLVAHGIAK